MFAAVTAQEYRDELTRNCFINGLSSPYIRQRLLENDNLNLARALQVLLLRRSIESDLITPPKTQYVTGVESEVTSRKYV